MIILGFMLIGWFLSMWLSNTATTAMLMPIAIAVSGEFDPQHKTENSDDCHEMEGKDNGEKVSQIQGTDLQNQSSSDELLSQTGTTEAHLLDFKFSIFGVLKCKCFYGVINSAYILTFSIGIGNCDVLKK